MTPQEILATMKGSFAIGKHSLEIVADEIKKAYGGRS